jgi:hypothetical protein
MGVYLHLTRIQDVLHSQIRNVLSTAGAGPQKIIYRFRGHIRKLGARMEM